VLPNAFQKLLNELLVLPALPNAIKTLPNEIFAHQNVLPALHDLMRKYVLNAFFFDDSSNYNDCTMSK
jgi:hypothetical protein